MAKAAGLESHFDQMLVTNSLKAHRLIQMAKTKGLGEKAGERLFYAYFKEGRDLFDEAALTELGNSIGLTDAEVKEVPFFVIDRKYAIPCAQPGTKILKALQIAYNEWKKNNPGPIQVTQGNDFTINRSKKTIYKR